MFKGKSVKEYLGLFGKEIRKRIFEQKDLQEQICKTLFELKIH